MDKHPMVVAWEKWMSSAEGVRCLTYETLTPGEYLENRLREAFQAGADARRAADWKRLITAVQAAVAKAYESLGDGD